MRVEARICSVAAWHSESKILGRPVRVEVSIFTVAAWHSESKSSGKTLRVEGSNILLGEATLRSGGSGVGVILLALVSFCHVAGVCVLVCGCGQLLRLFVGMCCSLFVIVAVHSSPGML